MKTQKTQIRKHNTGEEQSRHADTTQCDGLLNQSSPVTTGKMTNK